jgi:hypothetical protein
MSKTATLRGKISLDDTEFNKALRRATDRAKKFGADTAAAIGNAAKASLIGLGTAGLGAGVGLLAASKAAADLGGQLSDAAAITGVSADRMLVLQQAFKNAGMSGESAAGTIARLQAAIGRAGMLSEEAEEEMSSLRDRLEDLQSLKNTGLDSREQNRVNKEIEKTTKRIATLQSEAKGVAKAFKSLGLDQNQLAGMDGADQLQAVFEALGRLGSQSEKMAALRSLRLPPDLMVLAKDPNAFRTARTMLGGLVEDMGKFADKFDRVSDVFGSKFGILFQQIGSGFLKSIIDNPVFEQALAKFEALDLGFIGTAIGERASAAIDFIAETIRNGNLKETMSGVLKTGFAYAMDYLILGMGIAFATLGGVMNSIFSEHGMQFITGFGAALTGVLIIAAFNFGKILMAAWYGLEQKFADSPLGKVMAGAQAVGGAIKMTGTAIPSLFSDKFADMRNDGFASLGEGLRKIFDGSDPEYTALKQQEILNSNDVPLLNMTQSELLKASTDQAGEAFEGLIGTLQSIPDSIRQSYEALDMQKIRGSSSQNAQSTLMDTLSRMTPEQRASFLRIGAGGGSGSTPAPMPVQQSRPQSPLFDWTVPGRRSDQSSAGDNKSVSVLEQIASLLDRNLTQLQIA